jgi:hypothetical protein
MVLREKEAHCPTGKLPAVAGGHDAGDEQSSILSVNVRLYGVQTGAVGEAIPLVSAAYAA